MGQIRQRLKNLIATAGTCVFGADPTISAGFSLQKGVVNDRTKRLFALS